ncbi:hypothetical protein LEP1GSC192_0511 [Leptospira sp. B5-022]|nr:hypothetical protein LEP1GSC192_0511 [Leptospira sp. B5-022]
MERIFYFADSLLVKSRINGKIFRNFCPYSWKRWIQLFG